MFNFRFYVTCEGSRFLYYLIVFSVSFQFNGELHGNGKPANVKLIIIILIIFVSVMHISTVIRIGTTNSFFVHSFVVIVLESIVNFIIHKVILCLNECNSCKNETQRNMSTEHLRFEHIKVDWNLVYVFYNEKKNANLPTLYSHLF